MYCKLDNSLNLNVMSLLSSQQTTSMNPSFSRDFPDDTKVIQAESNDAGVCLPKKSTCRSKVTRVEESALSHSEQINTESESDEEPDLADTHGDNDSKSDGSISEEEDAEDDNKVRLFSSDSFKNLLKKVLVTLGLDSLESATSDIDKNKNVASIVRNKPTKSSVIPMPDLFLDLIQSECSETKSSNFISFMVD